MGKPAAKKKTPVTANATSDIGKTNHRPTSRPFDEDMEIFITRALELKEEGNKLFQKHDNEGAMLTYDKAVKLLPKDHIDVAYLRTSLASCYMRMGLDEYPNAINECNLALKASPRYSKALVRRSRCYEALNKLDYAFRDVIIVLNMEPENVSAKEVFDRVKKKLVEKGIDVDEMEKSFVNVNVKKSKKKKRSGNKAGEENKMEEDKVVVMDKKVITIVEASEKTVTKTVKLVHGDDIRWAELPLDSSVILVRDLIKDRFPNLRGFLIKYEDPEGDLITITTTDELRLAASSNHDKLGSLRLYIAEVNPDQEPVYDGIEEYVESDKASMIYQFAEMFKNHVGFDSDSYLDLHDLGMKLYTEAMEEAVTGEDAQKLFEIAADKFQEMGALAMFNLGNIHMSKARKQVCFSEDASREDVIEAAFVWTLNEYNKAAEKYEEAIKIKPDFYEAFIALGQQQFEQAKLLWSKESEASQEVLMLYNKAEDSMERGMQIWEEMEETLEKTANMSSQINLLWGSLLYERSIVEYKLGLLTWDECLEVAVEKFELAGASATDIAVMVKNHCSSESVLEGMGFKIDEIVQAWNEMYDAKRWQTGIPSFRLEPMFRRRAPKLHDVLENVFSGSA